MSSYDYRSPADETRTTETGILVRRDDSTYRHLRGGSPERIAAVRAHYDALHAEAHAAILSVFPEAETGRRSDGEIEVAY